MRRAPRVDPGAPPGTAAFSKAMHLLDLVAHCTAVGKVMAAFLESDEQRALLSRLTLTAFTTATLATRPRLTAALAAIRRAGIAFDSEEHVTGIHCVAAPVFDFRGRCIGGISMTAPRMRVDLRTLK